MPMYRMRLHQFFPWCFYPNFCFTAHQKLAQDVLSALKSVSEPRGSHWRQLEVPMDFVGRATEEALTTHTGDSAQGGTAVSDKELNANHVWWNDLVWHVAWPIARHSMFLCFVLVCYMHVQFLPFPFVRICRFAWLRSGGEDTFGVAIFGLVAHPPVLSRACWRFCRIEFRHSKAVYGRLMRLWDSTVRSFCIWRKSSYILIRSESTYPHRFLRHYHYQVLAWVRCFGLCLEWFTILLK